MYRTRRVRVIFLIVYNERNTSFSLCCRVFFVCLFLYGVLGLLRSPRVRPKSRLKDNKKRETSEFLGLKFLIITRS